METVSKYISTALRFYFDKSLRVPCPEEASINDAKKVLSALSMVSTHELIQYFISEKENIRITSGLIPQFSSLEDCFNAVDKLVRSGMDGVHYEKVGFFLRTRQRKTGADRKYGENHIKCAMLMHLCTIEYGVRKNAFSYAYEQLDNETKVKLRPKLCLGMDIIRAYFVQNQLDSYLTQTLACVSESTQKRRMSSIKSLINTVKSDLL